MMPPQVNGSQESFDIGIAVLALLLLSPVLLIAAIAIKLGSRGPVALPPAPRRPRRRRVRAAQAAHDGARLRPGRDRHRVARDDPRVTGAGRLLRRTSLDEIPNLVNVLRGEMAIVGPRPTIPAQVAEYIADPAPPPRGAPRDHRLGPGPGPGRDPLGAADRARRRVRRTPRRRPRPAHPGEDRLAAGHRPRPRPRLAPANRLRPRCRRSRSPTSAARPRCSRSAGCGCSPTRPSTPPGAGTTSAGAPPRASCRARRSRAAELGPIDAVLLSHDQHDDNLDDAGRAMLPSAGSGDHDRRRAPAAGRQRRSASPPGRRPRCRRPTAPRSRSPPRPAATARR